MLMFRILELDQTALADDELMIPAWMNVNRLQAGRISH